MKLLSKQVMTEKKLFLQKPEMSWRIFVLRNFKSGFYFLPFYENRIEFSEQNTTLVEYDSDKNIILPDGVTQVFGLEKSCYILESLF